MVYASLKAYLEEYVAEMARHFRKAFSDLPERLASKKAKSWFERYRLLFLDDMGRRLLPFDGEVLLLEWHGRLRLAIIFAICLGVVTPRSPIRLRCSACG